MLMQYEFTDYLDLSQGEHYALAQILDNMTVQEEPEGDYEDFFSLSLEV